MPSLQLLQGREISEGWTSGHSELLEAMRGKDVERMKRTIQAYHVDVNLPHMHRNGHYSYLFHAVTLNFFEGFQTLLDAGADPTWINKSQNSVLNLIIKRKRVQFFQACLEKLDEAQTRSFVNQSTYNGWSVLMIAADGCAVDMSAELVANGAEVNHTMESGWTAMHAAAKVGNVNTLSMLLSRGGNKNILAKHKEFGQNLKVEDVTADSEILGVLSKYY